MKPTCTVTDKNGEKMPVLTVFASEVMAWDLKTLDEFYKLICTVRNFRLQQETNRRMYGK